MKNPKKSTWILALISLFLFLIVIFNLSTFSPADSFFNSLSLSIQTPALIQLSEIISFIFEPVYVIAFSLILSLFMWARKARKDSVLFAILMILGGIAMYLLKEIIQRARPLNALISETSSSFPSGHALISLIFFGFLIYLALRKIKSIKTKTIISIILIAIMLIVGASRILLNVHWFSDVLGGWFLGLFILLASISIKQH